MAFNENTAQRIRDILKSKKVKFAEKKMFMGLCFMVEDKMLCGTHTDKKSEEEFLLCRINPEEFEKALTRKDVVPMEMGKRISKGYVFVKEDGFKSAKDLGSWLQKCLDFNPLAKSSKKK